MTYTNEVVTLLLRCENCKNMALLLFGGPIGLLAEPVGLKRRVLRIYFNGLNGPLGESDPQLHAQCESPMAVLFVFNPEFNVLRSAAFARTGAHFARNPCVGKFPANVINLRFVS
jgi:hypothetical protein